MYLVGGAVRDKLMGKAPKDFDFSVVLDEKTDLFVGRNDGTFDYFASMQANLIRKHGVTFFPGNAQKPEFFTAKGKFPKGHQYSNLVAEFVLARKEGDYRDGRRPDTVQMGTLHDDLARRDFTMNAIAQAKLGTFIDPFGGQDDIRNGLIRTVGDPVTRMMEDSLRALRALRFHVTLGFNIHVDLHWVLENRALANALAAVSNERKMDELNKMFRHNTLESLKVLNRFPALRDAIFTDGLHLEATLKQKGFN